MRRKSRLMLVLPLVGAAVLAGGTGAAAVTTLWPTYHLDPGRSGNDVGEPSFHSASVGWTTGALDGAIYAEPLVDGSDVIVATENNSLYAFSATNGAPQWGPVSLGTPRTSNFPCGDIMPLGITGTPVIDGGFLYAVAEVQTAPTTFAYHLARLNPLTGAVSYNVDITPSGMDTNVQQERSALTVSSGNVVVLYGGLDGDCGNYHGYIETVRESDGAAQHQWNDTSGGREGGMWAPSGAAVDASGNIYASTGNGSSSSLSNYDYGDSVLKFSSSLTLLSFFAPGSPQTWYDLNAGDQDLGSAGPSLLPGGLLFAIGKGGRGYLLNQSALPGSSNPGGGENAGAQVCSATGNAAFSGLAVSGNIVYVPCADGIAAVSIDSASAFHRIWYQNSGGGSSPILAGGLVWTLSMFGGSTLYGLQPATGQISVSVHLPASTEHFATPAAGDSRILIGAGNRLVAVDGDATGQYTSSTLYNNQPQVFTFDSTVNALLHAWYDNGWNVETLDGSGAATGQGQSADHVGTSNSALVYNGQLQDFYTDATTGSLRHAWWDGARWAFETLDGHGAGSGQGQTTDSVGTGNSALVYNGQLQDFYTDSTSGALRHAWWDGSHWNFETLDGTGGRGGATGDHVGQFNSAILFSGQPHDFYWDATSGALRHAWWDGSHWNFETLDGSGGRSGATGDHVGQFNSAILYSGQPHAFYWDAASGSLRHAWWDGAHWNFETLDGPGAASGLGQVSDSLGSYNSALVFGSQLQDFYYDISQTALRHGFWTGERWHFETLT